MRSETYGKETSPHLSKPHQRRDSMNISIESTLPKLDQGGAMAALSIGAEKFSFLQGSDRLSECVVRVCVEDFGISSAWLYEISDKKEPVLQSNYPHTNNCSAYQSVTWSDDHQIRRLIERTVHSRAFGVICNPDIDDRLDTIRTNDAPESMNAIAAFPLMCRGGTIGALVLCSSEQQFFSIERIRFLQLYAQLAAFAIHNGQLICTVQRESQERARVDQSWRSVYAELEKRVSKRTEQLEDANSELEAFSFSVSHDLKAPLWATRTLIEQLMESDHFSVGEDSKGALTAIQQSTSKMSDLIEHLLSFSRSYGLPLHGTEIDMTAIVQSVIDELLHADSGNSLKVTVAPLLPAHGDPSMIRQVWVNLLSNAFKYTRTKTNRRISVTSYETDDDIAYTIADNGVGFDMKYSEKLFRVFQRLHSDEEFEGTGVGLSIVQRIVRRHGGRVWAEGEVDKGAKFHFSLPIINVNNQ
jgi:signal transduction histidine kinase